MVVVVELSEVPGMPRATIRCQLFVEGELYHDRSPDPRRKYFDDD